MAFFRKAVLASTMIAAGLASTTGAALAHDDEGHEGDKSLINAQGTDAANQASACDIYVPILDVLPIDEADVNGEVPALNKQGDGNASTDVPNQDQTCTPQATDGAVDSPGGDTADADTDAATRGEDD